MVDGSKTTGRIDLYKKGCFVMEAKQSRENGRSKAVEVRKPTCSPLTTTRAAAAPRNVLRIFCVVSVAMSIAHVILRSDE
jgi:hypothetical protein